MKNTIFIIAVICSLCGCKPVETGTKPADWTISVIPSSVRIDPTSNEIIDHKFLLLKDSKTQSSDLLKENLIYDGNRVSLHAARGEYISFQLVVSNQTDKRLEDIHIEMPEFAGNNSQFNIKPELFLEWAVEVKTPSTGYPKASLGTGWYPDALIPFRYIQQDSAKVKMRWESPLWLPDFNNRIDNQKSMIVWIDQYIPFKKEEAKPGKYATTVFVTINGLKKEIPVVLTVWDFALPNENNFKACLQHEGFMRDMDYQTELEVYQLFRRNRVAMLDPTYEPELKILDNGRNEINWDSFDERLNNYFSGKAFTAEFGYQYGPGYGEPIENFCLPFDVYGKHGTNGWPDVGKPDVERNPENRANYVDCIKLVRSHLNTLIDPVKTDITAYLNGLDESYFPEAWSRMVYYGDIFHEYYPEASFRIDGGYTEEAMEVVKNSINSWASHTVEYDLSVVKKYQDMGIKVWIYGPMLYESKVNSWVGSSTFLDMPLVNDRAISWSCWKYRAFSWISWGAGASWVKGWYDPERKDASKGKSESDAEFTYKKINGNARLIYAPGVVPNVDGPCPSIRLKAMRDGIQEYEYMRMLAERDKGSERVDSLVNSIIKLPFGPNSIGNLNVWSFEPDAWDKTRIAMGKFINEL